MSESKKPQCYHCRYEPSEVIVPDDLFEAAFCVWSCPRCHKENAFGAEPADFKFSHLEKLSRFYAGSLSLTAPLQPVRDAFIRNLDRVVALGKLPRMFNLHWENTRRAEAEARGQGPRVITSGPPIEWQPWPVHAVQLEPRPFSVDFLFGKVPIGSRFAVEGLMASMLIGTWTAFETLASDLWEEALNCHPQALAALSGDPSSWQNDNSSEGKRDEQKSGGGSGDKSLSLGLIQGHITDLFQQLGTLLRYRYSFQTLPVIRKAYGQAFSKDFEEIRGILVDTSFDHLAGTRNILVHRAGKADSKFQSQTRDCAHFSQIQDGDLVVLNGIIVADIMSKAITQAVKLLIAVDKWICDHPQDV